MLCLFICTVHTTIYFPLFRVIVSPALDAYSSVSNVLHNLPVDTVMAVMSKEKERKVNGSVHRADKEA